MVVWPFTTMNSHWVAHVSAQKITETTKSLKICYIVFIFEIVRQPTKMTHQQQCRIKSRGGAEDAAASTHS